MAVCVERATRRSWTPVDHRLCSHVTRSSDLPLWNYLFSSPARSLYVLLLTLQWDCAIARSAYSVMRLGPLTSVLRYGPRTVNSSRSVTDKTYSCYFQSYKILPAQSARLAARGPQPGATTRLIDFQRCLRRITSSCSGARAIGISNSAARCDSAQPIAALLSSPLGQTGCATRAHSHALPRTPNLSTSCHTSSSGAMSGPAAVGPTDAANVIGSALPQQHLGTPMPAKATHGSLPATDTQRLRSPLSAIVPDQHLLSPSPAQPAPEGLAALATILPAAASPLPGPAAAPPRGKGKRSRRQLEAAAGAVPSAPTLDKLVCSGGTLAGSGAAAVPDVVSPEPGKPQRKRSARRRTTQAQEEQQQQQQQDQDASARPAVAAPKRTRAPKRGSAAAAAAATPLLAAAGATTTALPQAAAAMVTAAARSTLHTLAAARAVLPVAAAQVAAAGMPVAGSGGGGDGGGASSEAATVPDPGSAVGPSGSGGDSGTGTGTVSGSSGANVTAAAAGGSGKAAQKPRAPRQSKKAQAAATAAAASHGEQGVPAAGGGDGPNAGAAAASADGDEAPVGAEAEAAAGSKGRGRGGKGGKRGRAAAKAATPAGAEGGEGEVAAGGGEGPGEGAQPPQQEQQEQVAKKPRRTKAVVQEELRVEALRGEFAAHVTLHETYPHSRSYGPGPVPLSAEALAAAAEHNGGPHITAEAPRPAAAVLERGAEGQVEAGKAVEGASSGLGSSASEEDGAEGRASEQEGEKGCCGCGEGEQEEAEEGEQEGEEEGEEDEGGTGKRARKSKGKGKAKKAKVVPDPPQPATVHPVPATLPNLGYACLCSTLREHDIFTSRCGDKCALVCGMRQVGGGK